MVNSIIRKIFLVVSVLVLISCGGGGGDSSSGGGIDSALTGNYIGPARVTISGAGGTVSETYTAVVNVAENGQIIANFLELGNDGTTCTGVDPVFLNGSSFSYTDDYTCNIPGIGTCNIRETGSGQISGDTMTANISGTASCAAGSLAITITFSGTKQTATSSAFTGSSSQPGVGDMIRDTIK